MNPFNKQGSSLDNRNKGGFASLAPNSFFNSMMSSAEGAANKVMQDRMAAKEAARRKMLFDNQQQGQEAVLSEQSQAQIGGLLGQAKEFEGLRQRSFAPFSWSQNRTFLPPATAIEPERMDAEPNKYASINGTIYPMDVYNDYWAQLERDASAHNAYTERIRIANDEIRNLRKGIK